ncbi:MAG: TauD/TfdA family dioxygenase, partial [Pseudomonadota bacterium]|nr:TauD/TfdA family dioxygenase [Pseudomonadota bacterium]
IARVSNLQDARDVPIGGLGSGELKWHTDQSYMQEPATGAVLHAIEAPENGPKTYWANLALAYASLPDSTKRKLEGKRGVFSYAKRVSGYDQETTPEEVQRKTPDVTDALVNEHPITGTGLKALYLNPATTTGVEGTPQDEGISLLGELATNATSSAFIYENDWQVCDIIIWNNGFLLHKRDAFGIRQNRLLKRTTI